VRERSLALPVREDDGAAGSGSPVADLDRHDQPAATKRFDPCETCPHPFTCETGAFECSDALHPLPSAGIYQRPERGEREAKGVGG